MYYGAEVVPANSVWSHGQGNAQAANAARREHATIDAAAIAVIRYAMPGSVAASKEFGGSICRNATGRFIASVPNVGDAGHVFPSNCPANTIQTGTYHTHPGLAPLDGPSEPDVHRSYDLGEPGFVGTGKDVTVNQPVDCAPSGQGNIWKWVMDTTKPYDGFNPPFSFFQVIACTPVK